MAAIENSTNVSLRLYQQGWIILGYGLIWFAILAAGFTFASPLFTPSSSIGTILLALALGSALAGGVAAVTAMWQRLARSLVMEQDAERPSLFSFLLQPLNGVIVGILSLFLVTLPGSLLINYAATRSLDLASLAATSTFVALLLLVAWVAGYYHQTWFKQWRNKDDKKADAKALTTLDTSFSPVVATDPISESPLAFQVWAEQRRRVIRWSVTWGIFIFIYSLVWLIGLLGGLLGSGSLFPTEAEGNSPWVNLLAAGWPAILAGGIGGVIGLLYELYNRISFERDFDRQHIIAYMILPFTGLVLGGAMYLFIASGYLSLQSLYSEAPPIVDSAAVIACYLVLGWVVGFRQQALHGLIRRLVRAVISFFRFCLSLLSPKLLWDQAKRADTLAEIANQREVFRPIERD